MDKLDKLIETSQALRETHDEEDRGAYLKACTAAADKVQVVDKLNAYKSAGDAFIASKRAVDEAVSEYSRKLDELKTRKCSDACRKEITAIEERAHAGSLKTTREDSLALIRCRQAILTTR